MTVGGIEQDAYASDEMSLRDYWALARRRKWYIIAPVLFALGYSLATSMSTTPMYRAKADVLVQAAPVPGAVSSETGMTARTLNNELLRAQGSALEDQARQQVGDEPTMRVSLAQDRDADLFVFTAESRSAERAAEAANAYADTYVASRQADLAADFQSQAEVLQQQLDDAMNRLDESGEGAGAEELRVIIAGYRADIDEVQTAAKLAEESGASVVNVAGPPKGPFSPQPVRSAILAVLLGLFAGIAAAFIRDFTDNHIRTPEGLEQATGLPTSAVVPRISSWKKAETHVIMLEDSSSPQAEAYRSLRARIQFRRVDRQIRSMMVTSARPGEGKTTTSSNLAVAFAAAGENTVLVDLDMRRPRIHKFFDLSNEHGMSTVLLGADLESAIHPLPSVPNLSVVAAGPSTGEASEILHDDSLEEVLSQLKARFDVVVVDTPPVLAVADPLTISHYCDGTLLVVSASGTDKRDAELAAGQLAGIGAPMVGAVLNNYNAAQTGYSYSYAYSDYKPTERSQDWVPGQSGSGGANWESGGGTRSADLPEAPKLSRRQRRKLTKDGTPGADGLHSAGRQSDVNSDLANSGVWIEGTNAPPRDASNSTTGQGSETGVIAATEVTNLAAPSQASDNEAIDGWAVEAQSGGPADSYVVEAVGEVSAPASSPTGFDSDWLPSGSANANDAGDAAASGMSAVDMQEYLRAELRQARLDHVQGVDGDNGAVPPSQTLLANEARSGSPSNASYNGSMPASEDGEG